MQTSHPAEHQKPDKTSMTNHVGKDMEEHTGGAELRLKSGSPERHKGHCVLGHGRGFRALLSEDGRNNGPGPSVVGVF